MKKAKRIISFVLLCTISGHMAAVVNVPTFISSVAHAQQQDEEGPICSEEGTILLPWLFLLPLLEALIPVLAEVAAIVAGNAVAAAAIASATVTTTALIASINAGEALTGCFVRKQVTKIMDDLALAAAQQVPGAGSSISDAVMKAMAIWDKVKNCLCEEDEEGDQY